MDKQMQAMAGKLLFIEGVEDVRVGDTIKFDYRMERATYEVEIGFLGDRHSVIIGCVDTGEYQKFTDYLDDKDYAVLAIELVKREVKSKHYPRFLSMDYDFDYVAEQLALMRQ